ncbi:hypothetical protein AAIG97_34995, partial [Pseudomonas aeruginosa]|uniref:hypothetical protein n=1 Tax=Pseudomonas aeruginosa TaxID=287 RepID=UPI0031B76ECD
FILGFAWAGTVVIATWPVLLRLQKIMFGRRSLAVLVMTLLLVMVFIIPIAFGAVFSHHDCGMSVDCTTLYSRLCMGRYSGYRHLAGIVTFAKD